MTNTIPGIRRLLACLLYEALVVFAILLIGFLLPQVALSGFGMIASGKLLWLHVLVLLATYFTYCWSTGGQTLPMKTWKIKVVSTNNTPVRPTQALLRYFSAWLSLLLLGAGFLWILIDPQRRSLHDLIAGTRVVSSTE
jgi:uncharacterized RDD family membrane protein YckC